LRCDQRPCDKQAVLAGLKIFPDNAFSRFGHFLISPKRVQNVPGSVLFRCQFALSRCAVNQRLDTSRLIASVHVANLTDHPNDRVWSKNPISLKTRDVGRLPSMGAIPTLQGDFLVM
jgi:hypothetical protein